MMSKYGTTMVSRRKPQYKPLCKKKNSNRIRFFLIFLIFYLNLSQFFAICYVYKSISLQFTLLIIKFGA